MNVLSKMIKIGYVLIDFVSTMLNPTMNFQFKSNWIEISSEILTQVALMA